MLCAVGLKADAMMQTRGKNFFFYTEVRSENTQYYSMYNDDLSILP